jgi:(E)-4-hydroxy-3-methylbut-2-enyl-diphosphate synthase
MTKTPTGNIKATVNQIRELEQIGCDIIRVAVPDMEAARAISPIRRAIHIPLIADIHFDHRLALGILLAEGIGDAIRVSLADKPANEVRAGREILRSLGLQPGGLRVIACPTCGRAQMNVLKLARAVEEELEKLETKEIAPDMSGTAMKSKKCRSATPLARRNRLGGARLLHNLGLRAWPLVAVMGCVVNGPGEAREADIALVCGKNKVFLYMAGVKTITLDAKSAPAVVAEKALEFCSRKADI